MTDNEMIEDIIGVLDAIIQEICISNNSAIFA